MKKRWIYIGAFGLLVIIGLAWKLAGNGTPAASRRTNAPLVKVETPRRETVATKLQFTGDVVAIQQASIYSKVSGNLEHVYVDMGSRARRNQPLALIDTTELYQQYQQAAATYQNARISLERSKDLFAQNLVAKQDLDNAEAAYGVAKANYDGAVTRLSYAHITAPFTGYITKRFLDPGVYVTTNNSTLFTLIDLDTVKIIVNVLEKDIPLITKEVKGVVTVDAYPGKQFTGQVRRFAGAVDPGTRTMAVEIDILNREELLKPGMFANVTVIVNTHPDAITVPTVALLKDDRGYYIFTLDGDTARRTNVVPGSEQGERTEIASGLQGTEKLVSVGQQFLKDGSPVNVQQ